jgi:hypothetical protein
VIYLAEILIDDPDVLQNDVAILEAIDPVVFVNALRLRDSFGHQMNQCAKFVMRSLGHCMGEAVELPFGGILQRHCSVSGAGHG